MSRQPWASTWPAAWLSRGPRRLHPATRRESRAAHRRRRRRNGLVAPAATGPQLRRHPGLSHRTPGDGGRNHRRPPVRGHPAAPAGSPRPLSAATRHPRRPDDAGSYLTMVFGVNDQTWRPGTTFVLRSTTNPQDQGEDNTRCADGHAKGEVETTRQLPPSVTHERDSRLRRRRERIAIVGVGRTEGLRRGRF